jgi:hypothetical protein
MRALLESDMRKLEAEMLRHPRNRIELEIKIHRIHRVLLHWQLKNWCDGNSAPEYDRLLEIDREEQTRGAGRVRFPALNIDSWEFMY